MSWVYFVICSCNYEAETDGYVLRLATNWATKVLSLFDTSAACRPSPPSLVSNWHPGLFPGNLGCRDMKLAPTSMSCQVRNAWSCIWVPLYVFVLWCLISYRDNVNWRAVHVLLHSYTKRRVNLVDRGAAICLLYLILCDRCSTVSSALALTPQQIRSMQ